MSSNQSTGQWIGTIVGAVSAYFSGGLYGWQMMAGSAIGGLIDPPKGVTTSGPRLADQSVQTSTYGAAIPRIYGTLATFGNVIWLENDKIKETVKKKKSGGKGGGGGSTVKTYTYSATFAVGLCSGPIAGIRRLWVGSKLIYDAGSDDVESIIASNEAATGFKVYLGTEDQQPDPRMQADKGIANTPAYRGLAYIVLYDYKLKDHGNSLMGATVKAEVMTDAGYSGWVKSFTRETAALSADYFGHMFHTPYTKSVEGVLFKTVSKTPGGLSTDMFKAVIHTYFTDQEYFEEPPTNLYFGIPHFAEGDFYVAGYTSGCAEVFTGGIGGQAVYSTGFSGMGTAPQVSLFSGAGVTAIAAKNTSSSASSIAFFQGEARVYSETLSCNTVPRFVPGEGNETLLVLTEALGVTTARVFSTPDFVLLDTIYPPAQISTTHGAYIQDGQLRVVFNVSGSAQLSRYDLATLTAVGAPEVLPTIGGSTSIKAWGVGNAIARMSSLLDSTVDILTAEKVTPGTALLSGIVEAEALQALSLSSADIDVATLTDEVRGYRVTQTGAIRVAIEPLQSAWPFDVIQSGYKIKAVKRGNASVATIPAELLDARAAGEAPGPQITIVREMDTQLPRRVSIKHMDITREYDIGEQSAERGSGESISVREMEMPIVFTASEAAQKAEVLLYLYWLERYTIQFKLPPAYLGLEPADVITIAAPDTSYELRLTNINYLSDGRLECVARYNSAAVYTSTATGEESAVLPGTIGLAGPSKYELLDIPAVHSSMDSPAFVAAMTGYTTTWPGGILFRSSDSGQTWDDVQGWTGKGTIGTARNAIGTQPSTTVDSASLLQVDMISGELESVTELAMLNGANYFAYGANGRWEIIAARTVTLQGDGSYLLQDMLRGRFGTEHNTGNHAAGDSVVLLNDPDNALITMDSASIGLERLYRGITAGRAIDSDSDRSFTYRAVNLECLSPVYLNGSRHPSTNDWVLTWVRRTRIGGEWRDLIDAPLSETSEAYEVDVFSSAAYTTLKRTLTSATPTVAYTSAQQVTDFGSNQATLYLRLYQLSATVGRGFPLQTSITR